jgi:cysteine-rich repeat protein
MRVSAALAAVVTFALAGCAEDDLPIDQIEEALVTGSFAKRSDTIVKGGGVIVNGRSLAGREDGAINTSATINIAGIPTNGVVQQALLYWAISGGNDTTATVNGTDVTGALIGTAGTTNWGVTNSTFFADVTSIVTGNGAYEVAGLPSSTIANGADTDGAALVVTYGVPTSGVRRRVVIHDGAVSMNATNDFFLNVFTSLAIPSLTTPPRFHLIVGDGSAGADGISTFAGTSLGLNLWNGAEGSLWDTQSFNGLFANLTQAGWTVGVGADALLLETAVLEYTEAVCGDALRAGGEGCDDANTANGDGCSSTCDVDPGWVCTGLPSSCQTVCGDGIVAGAEACDDGGSIDGDGCSAACAVELGWGCTGSPSACATTCGDGVKANIEACDDGDVDSGDGCSAACAVELGWACTGITPSTCAATCGDGVKANIEGCDDGGLIDGDGCSAACAVEFGWGCAGETPSACATTCGDGLKANVEVCDDGDVESGDGCSATCGAELGWACTGAAPSACATSCGDGVKANVEACDDGDLEDGDGCSATCEPELGWGCSGETPSTCATTCGDGLKANVEVCDDGDVESGDGCSATCAIDSGWGCTGNAPSTCATSCGDGVKANIEGCDDGGLIDGDGCSAACAVEFGWGCAGETPSACATTCGDGLKANVEACDDGDVDGGDGCSAACDTETGWTCTGSPSACATTCGDGIVAGAEACDDGGTADGDGCSASCTIDSGWTCAGAPSTCATTCGDGITAGAEACDDGGTADGDGCSASCTIDSGWTCAGAPSTCATTCGDGITAGAEACDDGGTADGDGCNAACSVDNGWTCAGAPSTCATTCGDGITAGAEACDDGGTASGDGCSASCTIDSGWTCAGAPSTCATTCGDGITAGAEACDDGGTADGDGCSAACSVDSGWTCAGAPSTCATTCGDGITAGAEACDDGGTADGDGCSAACSVDSGWTCAGAPSTCATTCGDGITAGAEACDDGGTASGDGCSASCTIDSGWTCAGAPSTCATTCGDGITAGAEACDDGGTADGDGCSAACSVDSGWTCAGSPSTCTEDCGDGQITGTEECDDGNTEPGDGCDEVCSLESSGGSDPGAFGPAVNWTHIVGVSQTGDDLVKVATTGGWESGAVTTRSIVNDGAVEFTTAEADRAKAVGLSQGDGSQHYEDIDFAFLLTDAGTVQIYEQGVLRGNFGAYAAGDVFRVEVTGETVRYRRNGAQLFVSTVTPIFPLIVDTSLNQTGATVRDVRFGETGYWQNVVGVAVNGTSLTKTTTTGWNAGASSIATLPWNGRLEFSTNEATRAKAAGLSNGDANRNYTDIDYAIYLSSVGRVQIYEQGALRGTFGSYAPGDLFRVEVTDGNVRYFRNGSLLYASTVEPVFPLLVDTAFSQPGATIENVQLTSAPACQITGSTLNGNYVIASAADAQALAGVGLITGNLTIKAPSVGSLTIPGLQAVKGAISFNGSGNPSSVSMPALCSTTYFFAGAGVSSYSLPRLRQVNSLSVIGTPLVDLDAFSAIRIASLVYVIDNPLLADVTGVSGIPKVDLVNYSRLPMLTTLDVTNANRLGWLVVTETGITSLSIEAKRVDGVTLRNNAFLADLGGLSSVEWLGELDVDHSPGLTSLSGLENVRGATDLYLQETGLVDLDALATVAAGAVDLRDNGALVDISALSSRRALASLIAWDNAALETIAFPSVRTVESTVQIRRNASLRSVSFPALEEVWVASDAYPSAGYGITVEDNDELTTTAFPSLISVSSLFAVVGNAALSSLAAPSLFEIRAMPQYGQPTLWIEDNPQLPLCHAAEIVEQLLASGFVGTIDISGGVACE